MMVGTYILDIYCDGKSLEHRTGEFPKRFTGPDAGDCRKQARDAGWKLGRLNAEESRDLCPKCSGKAPKAAPDGD